MAWRVSGERFGTQRSLSLDTPYSGGGAGSTPTFVVKLLPTGPAEEDRAAADLPPIAASPRLLWLVARFPFDVAAGARLLIAAHRPVCQHRIQGGTQVGPSDRL